MSDGLIFLSLICSGKPLLLNVRDVVAMEPAKGGGTFILMCWDDMSYTVENGLQDIMDTLAEADIDIRDVANDE